MSVEEAFDDCMTRLGAEGIQACLESYPAYRAELEPLLRLAAWLKATVAVASPSAEAYTAGRAQLLAAAAASASGRTPAGSADSRASSRPRLVSLEGGKLALRSLFATPLRAAAVILLVLGAVLGLSTPAASASLPGDPLYFEKLVGESLEVSFAGSGANAAIVHLKLADRRAAEVAQLKARGRTDLIPGVLANMAEHTRAGIAAIQLAQPAERDAFADRLAEVNASETTALADAAGNPASSASPAYSEADDTLKASRSALVLISPGLSPTPATSAATGTRIATEVAGPVEATRVPEATSPPVAVAPAEKLTPEGTTVASAPGRTVAPERSPIASGADHTPSAAAAIGAQHTPSTPMQPPGPSATPQLKFAPSATPSASTTATPSTTSTSTSTLTPSASPTASSTRTATSTATTTTTTTPSPSPSTSPTLTSTPTPTPRRTPARNPDPTHRAEPVPTPPGNLSRLPDQETAAPRARLRPRLDVYFGHEPHATPRRA